MDHAAIAEIYDLTPLQEGILFHCVSAPDTNVYNVQVAQTLSGALDPARLERCWQVLVDRHAPLRTCFAWERIEKPYQVVHSRPALELAVHDWRAQARAEREARLRQLADEQRRKPFDLRRAPLTRLTAVRLEDDEWRVLWTFHHIILEGWSAAIVLHELWTLYGDDGARELPQVRPYVEFVRWLKARDASADEAYWRRCLAGYREPPVLPIDAAGGDGAATPAALDQRGLRLPAARSDALRAAARAGRLTLSSVVHGLWAVLLGRYSGARDVVFGSAVSGRPAELAGAEAMVGLFVNVLPVRAHLSDTTATSAWLAAFQVELARVREHGHSSQMQIKAWSELAAGAPLFETVVAFENWLGDLPTGSVADGLAVGALEVHDDSDQPLSLFAVDGSELALTIKYDRERFDGAAIGRMLAHLDTLLAAFVADPAQPLGQLAMLTPTEYEQLAAWSRAPAHGIERECVHRLVAAQAARTPQAPAVVEGTRRLSYAELDLRANRLAHFLQARGVGKETLVVLLLERRLEFVVAALAVLRAGGAYVPLDPALPPARVQHVLVDSAAPVLLTHAALGDRIAGYAGEVVVLDALDTLLAAQPATDPGADCIPGDRAYVIYTSGSTGLPKGVEIAHAGLSNLIGWHRRAYALDAEDRCSHLAGLGFDGSVWELWPPLCAGASVHLVPDALRQAPAALLAWLDDNGISVAFMPTPLAEAAVREALPPGLRLRVLLTGGDRLHGGLTDRALPFALVNHYGPTENSVVASSCEVDPLDPAAPPIGRPIDNVSTWVLDDALRPVPSGFGGELCLGGAGVARGYLNQPQQTADRFVPDPFDPTPGARLYRTGDLVAYDEHGRLAFLGRRDRQIKVRGFRIEPGEIESALCAIAGVAAAAVVARADGGAPRLVAYLVCDPPATVPDAAALREALTCRLPEYMVPASFVALDQLPLSPSGKVDLDALPAPPREQPAAATAPATSSAERTMTEIWEHLLEIDDVRPDDMFLDLGGHSLLAIKVAEAWEHETGGRLKPTDVVRYPLRQLVGESAPARRARGRGLLRSIRQALGGREARADG